MLLKITHATDLSYSAPITESVMELRMVPRQAHEQHRLSFNLAIGPATSALSYFDWLGNTVHAFAINAPHDKIRIVATSIVEIERRCIDPAALSDAWPVTLPPEQYELQDYLRFGGPIVDSRPLRDVVQSISPRQREPLGTLAWRMLDLIAEKFVYRSGVTTSASPITEMLEHGGGVCQDFTHLMIGFARAMNIPARYVSGYLHPESQRFRGYTQTHAWVEIYFPSTGWIGFDPANHCLASEHFVKVAVGRDFRDVPPNKGVFRGQASEEMSVQVKSESLETVPPELAADRMQTLNVPILPRVRPTQFEQVPQQQEHQQQQ